MVQAELSSSQLNRLACYPGYAYIQSVEVEQDDRQVLEEELLETEAEWVEVELLIMSNCLFPMFELRNLTSRKLWWR